MRSIAIRDFEDDKLNRWSTVDARKVREFDWKCRIFELNGNRANRSGEPVWKAVLSMGESIAYFGLRTVLPRPLAAAF